MVSLRCIAQPMRITFNDASFSIQTYEKTIVSGIETTRLYGQKVWLIWL